MKFLTERTEIAKAINLSGDAVIRINISECMNGYDNCYAGDKIKVKIDDITIDCTVKMFSDGEGNEDCWETPYLYKTIDLMPESLCISNSFGYSDVVEMAEWNRVPTVKSGDTVTVVFYDKENRVCVVRKMRVGKATKWVYPTATLEDIDD